MKLSPSCLLCLCLGAGTSSSFAGDAKGAIAPASSGGDWEFSISAGPAYRSIGQLKINSGYRSGGFALPSLVGPGALIEPAIGTTGAIATRDYEDGYVGEDSGTAQDGQTWNWGYDNPAQLQGNYLAMHATGFQSVRRDTLTAPASGPSSRSTLDTIAPHLQFDAKSPYHLGPFRVGFTAGLDYANVSQSRAFSNFAASQNLDRYRVDYEDLYDVSGIIVPQAPYSGTATGPGPVIANIPSIRNLTTELIGTDTANFRNQVWSSIDIDAFSFTMGPTLSLQKGRMDFAVSAGLIVNVYDWSARQQEILTVSGTGGSSVVSRWSESDSGIKVRPGVYLQGEAGYALTEQIGLTGFLRLDAASEFRAQAGPTVYKIDPYGVTAGFQIRYMLP